MSENICDYRGEQDAQFRAAVYAGTIFRLPPTDASLNLIRYCWKVALDEFGEDPRVVGSLAAATRDRSCTAASFEQHSSKDSIAAESFAANSMDMDDNYFRQVGRLRRRLYGSETCRHAIAKLVEQVGAIPREHVVDPVRSRLIAIDGHLHAAAASVYYAHRDTWYANPPTQITWWLPLHDVTADHTFEFLPECFSLAVLNDSEGFDYDRWTGNGPQLKIGWQDASAGLRENYPRLLESLPGQRRFGFEASIGEVIVFSGQHLHQTRPIESGRARLSIDFRTIHVPDYRKRLGPTNVDNRSTGDAFVGHLPLVAAGLA